ncbi:MAG TPA: zinc ribbon domain-containing protein, partial [Geobacteraceae bacterium]
VRRRLVEASGMTPGGGIEEALGRLEAGEDPASVEAELGDLLDGEELFSGGGLRKLKRKFTPPARDDTLYLL